MVKQHRMVVCRMTMEKRKRKRVKAEPKIRWWKLRKEDCCEQFREEVKQALSCCERRCMNGQLLLMLSGRQLGKFLVCHQDRRKIETLDGGMRKCRNVLEERDWPKRTGITREILRNKIDRSTRICAVKLKE